MRDGMPLPATVSLVRSGNPSSRLETKKRGFPKSNVGKLNSVKPGIVQKARGGGWAACFVDKESAYLILKENLPGALVANLIGRKRHVSTPKGTESAIIRTKSAKIK